jgi:Na+-transporting methylmalonyl-CoA/oxaloacetate decarboxylase gamma subunit
MEVSPVNLMVIGMITVSIVLTLVVLCGNLLINLVNKYIPEEEQRPLQTTTIQTSSSSIESKKLSAIVAAVDWATKGKGKITKIEKK